MNKILIACLLILQVVLAADAKFEIVKGGKKVPTIMIHIGNADLEQKISKLLIKDLEMSGNFSVVSQEKEREENPSYVFYQAKSIDLFAFIFQENGGFGLELFDVHSKKKVLQRVYKLPIKEYPFLAHKMANAINQYLGAPSIEWMERKIVLSKLIAPSKSAIVIADYTLTFQENIIDDGLNIFPKWADKEQTSIFFTKYLDQPTILKYDLKKKKFKKILSSQGIAVVSDVSDDYQKILVSMSPIAQADVYLYDLMARSLKRLTNYPGIDVGANFVENKKKIIFISDRLGYPNVFSMNFDGSGVEQAVFHGRNNSSTTSNGEYVVYSSREEKNEFGTSVFNLYLIGLDGSAIRRLTSYGANQMPRFSQDGENIMFLKNTETQSALGIVRLRYNKTFLFPISKVKIQSFDW